MIPAASDPPPAMHIVYTPVMRPVRSGKSRLITAGTSTLASAIEAPITSVPRKSIVSGGASRIRIPIVSPTIVSQITRSIPNRRASFGATAARAPKQITGSVVSKPASVVERPVSSRIASSNGPTATIEARRLKAATAMPIASAGRSNRDGLRKMIKDVRSGG